MLEKQQQTIHGVVIARDVTFEAWMELYADKHTEWVHGTVVKMSPVSRKHDELDGFLYMLLRFFLNRTQLGVLLRQPFVMRASPDSPSREPDLHIVLNGRSSIIKDTMTDGPADVAIEIVSLESRERDLVEKYEEYEAGGIREYWIFNPLRQQADFYVLGEDKLYKRIELKDGVFQSVVLPRFSLDTGILWQPERLQDTDYISGLVDAMSKVSE